METAMKPLTLVYAAKSSGDQPGNVTLRFDREPTEREIADIEHFLKRVYGETAPKLPFKEVDLEVKYRPMIARLERCGK